MTETTKLTEPSPPWHPHQCQVCLPQPEHRSAYRRSLGGPHGPTVLTLALLPLQSGRVRLWRLVPLIPYLALGSSSPEALG